MIYPNQGIISGYKLDILRRRKQNMPDYIKLGGTLFIPATHKNLELIVNAKKYKNLKSVVVDTEDSIAENDLEKALLSVKKMLQNLKKTDILVFIRPRNPFILEGILAYEHIEKVDGFLLPKFSLANATMYLTLLEKQPYFFMPSVEGEELFESAKLLKLCDIILPYKKRIILVRFGLEDMLRQLKMRRKCEDSVFDLSASSWILGTFLSIFKSAGFEVSGGVFPCFKDEEGFRKDVERDLKEGLFSKTIIHPSQIEPINDLYKVSQEEYEEALAIVNLTGEVSEKNAKMLEKKTMYPYADYILQRAKEYGVKK